MNGKTIIWDAENDRILCRLGDLEEVKEEDEVEVDIKDLKVAELKELLDEKGIEYDAKAKKDDLIELLEGAE